MTESQLKIFKPVFTNTVFTIKACSGQRKICNAREVFKSGIDPDFENFGLNKPGKPTVKIVPVAYRLQGDFVFSDETGISFYAGSDCGVLHKIS